MKLNLKIHKKNHLIKSIFGNIEYLFTKTGRTNNELYVVNYHGTQIKFISEFRKQILFLRKGFHLISPIELKEFYAGNLNNYHKPLLLITFDDGIKNNLYAADVLNEYNIKALFFIVPQFIDTPQIRQKEYFTEHIRRNINPDLDSEIEDFTALSWENVKSLELKGHSIGSHTQTHIFHSGKESKQASENEIINSKINISEKANLPNHKIDSFCSIFDTVKTITRKEVQLIKENYSFHFTTIPGPNFSNSNPYFIKRSNIEAYWLKGAIKYAMGKWDLKRWEKKVEYINEML